MKSSAQDIVCQMNPDEQSECSENSVNMSNKIYGSSIHSDQQSEAMHMACI
jgi:hypothetical protein